MNWIEGVKLGVSCLTLISIVIAYLAYRANVRKQNEDRERDKDKELAAQAQKSIQWAFEVLVGNDNGNPPPADRLNWLTSARHLIRASKLASQITYPTYRTIYDEVEEYWRHRFYTVLSHDALRQWTYYADQKNSAWPENIEITSALVVLGFANWKDGTPDPTDEANREKLIASGALKSRPGRGLESYMVRIEEARNRKGP